MGLIEVNKEFFGRFSRCYDAFIEAADWGLGLERAMEDVLEAEEVGLERTSAVLDAGCGTGNFLSLLTEKESLDLYGIDISKRMLEMARRKVGHRAKLKLQKVENLEHEERFDYIFSIDAFHHFSDQKKAMDNFYRALKEDGKLVVVELDVGIFNRALEILEPGNSGINTLGDFRELFRGAGLDVTNQRSLGLFTIVTFGQKTG